MCLWTPFSVNTLLVETMIEITSIVERNSAIAYMKLEYKIRTVIVSDSVARRLKRKIPARHNKLVSRMKTKNKIMIPMKVSKSQCMVVKLTCFFIPPF